MSTAEDLFRRAVHAAKSGDRPAARALFKRITEDRPEILQAWQWRAHLAEAPAEQIRFLERALLLDPENSKTRGALFKTLVETGIACAKNRAKSDARHYLFAATRLDPESEIAWLWLASLADTAAERLEYVEKILAINPANPSALAFKAELLNVDSTPSQQAGPTTVLVVDDSLTVRSLVRRTLDRRGCSVLMAADAGEAEARLEEKKPDLIFLDIDLPDTDGFELCRIIKSRVDTKDVPVLMLSGKDGAFDKWRGRMVGALDHISKPFKPDDLVQALQRFVGR